MTNCVAINGVEIEANDTGLEVLDLTGDTPFAERRLHLRDVPAQMRGMQRLAHAFVEDPDTVLQELVDAAVELCGADSAGISLEIEEKSDLNYWKWVATAGEYARFKNATLPRYPSACGVCLERERPQLFRVSQHFFDMMGIVAPVVTDGLLFPWQVGETRGTIWVMAHGRDQAFDAEDFRMMQLLADFAAMAVRHQQQQLALMNRAATEGAAAMANEMAHRINNPLQALTNVVYLAAEGKSGGDAKELGQALSGDVQRLSKLVNGLLGQPTRAAS